MSLQSIASDVLAAFEKVTPAEWANGLKATLADVTSGASTEATIAAGLSAVFPEDALLIGLAQIAIAVVPALVAAGVPADALSAAILSKNPTPYSSADDAPAATKSGEIPMGDD